MENKEEYIHFPKGNCDLDSLDAKTSEETIVGNIPRELNDKKTIRQLLNEYFQDELDTNEPWEELSNLIENICSNLNDKLDREFSYRVCEYIRKCKSLKVDEILKYLKIIIEDIIKFDKKHNEIVKEQLELINYSLVYVEQYVKGKDNWLIINLINCFEDYHLANEYVYHDSEQILLKDLLYELV